MLESPILAAMRSPLQCAMDRIGSAVWTPARLFAASEQGVWYDPSDLSTLFQDAAGTTPVTAVGQPVGRMLDKSGRGNHATQATTASKPTLEQDANGKYYLAFDGVDDGMSTAAVDFTATDKMGVFAGVRKQSDAGQVIAELSSTVDSNTGSFVHAAGNLVGGFYGALSRGTAAASGTQAATYPTSGFPDICVFTATHDLPGDSTIGRRNGTQFASATGDKGTGNFGNYPLYIGRRGGTSQPLNGRIYQLIIRGALTDAAGITAAEAFVNTKTAAY